VAAHPIPDPLGPGEESVWDYPRPPRLERVPVRIEIVLGGVLIASTSDAWRVLETSHPPNYYLPRDAFEPDSIVAAPGGSFCEWKGPATYWTLRGGGRVAEAAAWSYERPTSGFDAIAGHLAVYAGRVDECRVDGEVVSPQPGGFYGGWITRSIKGPFKGIPGSLGW
jgi:uncharacterized protein (DUF427 family)